jgi:hypothetical protein
VARRADLTKPPSEPEWVTVAEAARRLGMSQGLHVVRRAGRPRTRRSTQLGLPPSARTWSRHHAVKGRALAGWRAHPVRMPLPADPQGSHRRPAVQALRSSPMTRKCHYCGRELARLEGF